MNHSISIIISGPRYSGKTSIGKALATYLGFNYIDMDEYIISRHGNIDAIVKKGGWNLFRKIETQVLENLLKLNKSVDVIIILGGGTVSHNYTQLRKKNISLIKKYIHGPKILLLPYKSIDHSTDVLYYRFLNIKKHVSYKNPPLTILKPREEIKKVLRVRWTYYENFADTIFYTKNYCVNKVVKKIIKDLRLVERLRVRKLYLKSKNDDIESKELVPFLKARGRLQEELFNYACRIRNNYFGEKVLVRGTVEVSNYCRVDCKYCSMRRSYKKRDRFRLSAEEIFESCLKAQMSGIETVILQGGEDPVIDKTIEESLVELKKSLNLNIILCLGNRKMDQYMRFKKLGADGYILKFETSDPKLFFSLRGEKLDFRLKSLKDIKKCGYNYGTGNITGLPGQSYESIGKDILLIKKIDPDFVSTSPFISNVCSAFTKKTIKNIDLSLNFIAIIRIIMKDKLIPSVSALEIQRTGGQKKGLRAGANIITVNLTPPKNRKLYTIYCEKRHIVTMDNAFSTIKDCGLIPSIKSTQLYHE